MKKNLQYEYILKELSQNYSDFSYLDKKSSSTIYNRQKVKYDVFLEKNHRLNEQYIHIFFHKDANISATSNYIKKELKGLLSIKTLIYISRKQTDITKNAVIRILKPTNVDYIEDLIKEISVKKANQEFDRIIYDGPKAFVFPKIRLESINDESNLHIIHTEFTKKEEFKENFLQKWYEKEDTPVLIIKGIGGIGKTTIAQHISNEINRIDKNTSNVFINSIEAKRRLVRDYRHKTTIELYDLYKASMESENILDDILFNYNLDAGNFFIVIDGIDELISKVENFDINSFINSIIEFNHQFNSTKILITCRTQFWNFQKTEDSFFNVLEIDAFSLEKATSFFKESFSNDGRKVEKALALAKDFHKNNTSKDLYHPYALDLITKIINDKVQNVDEPNTSSLNTRLTLDYIVAKICNRENFIDGKVRVLDLSIDQQIKVFQEIAIHNSYGVNKNRLTKYMKKSKIEPNSILLESFLSHPLITVNNDLIKFSYDFLTDFFKSVYIAYHLDINNKTEELTSEFLDLLKQCWYGSTLNMDVCKRIFSWGEDEIFKIQYIIDLIDQSSLSYKQDYYSGIFNLALEINHSKSENNKIENTKFIKAIFGENEVKNLCIENVNSNKSPIVFNFQSFIFTDCVFNNYSDFWNNTWNEKDYFNNCAFLRLGTKQSRYEIPFKINKKNENMSNFNSQCRFDAEFLEQFQNTEDINEIYKEKVNKLITNFINYFKMGGGLLEQPYEKEKRGFAFQPFTKAFTRFGEVPINVDEFIEIAKKIGVVEFDTKQGKKTINIAKQHRNDVIKHIFEDAYCPILKILEDEIYNKIR
jgi:tRNA A37 threonylcarbamoyladenosine biosynthesis protein TsaE